VVGRAGGSAGFGGAVVIGLMNSAQAPDRAAARGEKSGCAAGGGAAPPELPGHAAGSQAVSRAAGGLTPPTPRMRRRIDAGGAVINFKPREGIVVPAAVAAAAATAATAAAAATAAEPAAELPLPSVVGPVPPRGMPPRWRTYPRSGNPIGEWQRKRTG
jgi:hypothetical protein